MGATGSKATSAGLPPVNAPVDSRQISTPAGPAPPAAAPAVSEASSAALKPEAVSEGKTSAAAALATVAPAAAAPIAETATADAAAVAAAAAREQRLRAAELEARARVLSSKVRCVECGHQSIEESNADVAIFMRKMIRDELRAGRQEGEILESLKSEYGDSVVYSPPFHGASAALWLTPSFRRCPSSLSSAPPGPSCCCLHQVFVLTAAAASAVRQQSCDAIACTVICATPIAAFLAPTGV
ncbi:unnamed protein product [Closterium sp. NIES-65]|nr:unnamed protein product [Closterium sp. NIES-65]